MKYRGPSLENAQHHYKQAPVADIYDAQRSKKEKWRKEHETMRFLLQGVSGSVLDVPVGTGRFLQLYKDLGLDAVGIDYSPLMLAQAREKYPDARLEQGDVTDLPYPDESFDAVVCVRLLHLVAPSEVATVMHELMRLARCHVIVSANIGAVSCPKKRSQIHTRGAIMNTVPPVWKLKQFICVMEADNRLGSYYMAHFIKDA